MASGASNALSLKNATVSLLMLLPLTVMILALRAGDRPSDETADRPPEDQPPIITLSEAQGYTFPSGSAVLTPSLIMALDSTVAPRLRRLAETYRCDIVEVIGHTDGQRMFGKSNLDATLPLAVDSDVAVLSGASNADLGLMRAYAVAAHLRRRAEFKGLSVLAYSAGQLLLPDGSAAPAGDHSDRPERRRIEIRVRRSK
jgi:outer membrane protein OmpA-like peptidoglycan-associated protein